jgi:hypothetical protein
MQPNTVPEGIHNKLLIFNEGSHHEYGIENSDSEDQMFEWKNAQSCAHHALGSGSGVFGAFAFRMLRYTGRAGREWQSCVRIHNGTTGCRTSTKRSTRAGDSGAQREALSHQ